MAFPSQIEPIKDKQHRLAITFSPDSDRVDLSVVQRDVPNLIISLRLNNISPMERKNLRTRLLRVLGYMCVDGGVIGVQAGLQPEFYLYSRANEAALLSFLFSRLSSILVLIRPVVRKRKSSLWDHDTQLAAPLGHGNLQLMTNADDGATCWIRIEMRVLLSDEIAYDIGRNVASTSYPLREMRVFENENGVVVVQVDGGIYRDDTEGNKKEALGMRVQQAFGAQAVQLRGGYTHQCPQLWKALPIDLSQCRTVQEVETKLPKKLLTMTTNLRAKCEPPTGRLLQLPTEACLHVLSMLPRRAPFRELSRECSSIVTENATTLKITEGWMAAEGAGASLMARYPGLKTLILKNWQSICEMGRFLAGGWSMPKLEALHIQKWMVGQSVADARRLAAVVSDMCRMDARQLVEFKVRLNGLHGVRPSRHAVAQLIRFVRALPYLSTLEISGRDDILIGLRNDEVAGLADALQGHTLRDLSLDLDYRTHSLGMRLDRVLEKVSFLVSLTLNWHFLEDDAEYYTVAMGKELFLESIRMLAAALSSLSQLRTLKLKAFGCSTFPITPVLTALAACPSIRLHTLDIYCVAWDGDSFAQLMRSGGLQELELLRVQLCKLHFTDLLKIFRDAIQPAGRSLLPRLTRVDVARNPLLDPMEALNDGFGVLPSNPIVLPPRLSSICIEAVRTGSFFVSWTLVDNVNQAFPSATVTI